ncbi:MAG TPA: HTH domain-containing protein, partial [Thermoleophilia bacterium]|nr:HTH domain-containing protein [Thermoleophilia bacterium]
MQGTPQDTRLEGSIKGSSAHPDGLQAAYRLDPDYVDSWLRSRLEWMDGGVAQRVRIVARLYSGERVSGQDLAHDLNISRAAVHKHV